MSQARSIGIIIDGNRRWAKEQGLNPVEGHRVGVRRVKDAIDWALERGHITDVFFYTLSTENWKRSSTELEHLLLLIELFFRVHTQELAESGVRIRIAGQRERFSKRIQKIFSEIEDGTAGNTGLTAWFGLSYGGRAEILDGVFTLIKEKRQITEDELRQSMWTADLPDPDLIIRTGGEHRLSNFLTWSSVYSELFFVDTYWPAFTKDELYRILDEFEQRERRMGV